MIGISTGEKEEKPLSRQTNGTRDVWTSQKRIDPTLVMTWSLPGASLSITYAASEVRGNWGTLHHGSVHWPEPVIQPSPGVEGRLRNTGSPRRDLGSLSIGGTRKFATHLRKA